MTEWCPLLRQGLRDVMGEPFSWRWFVPLPLPRDSPSFYEWKESDDPDAYDKRDPIIRRHFKKLQVNFML